MKFGSRTILKLTVEDRLQFQFQIPGPDYIYTHTHTLVFRLITTISSYINTLFTRDT